MVIEKFLLCNYCLNGFMEKNGVKCFGFSLICLRFGRIFVLEEFMFVLIIGVYSYGFLWFDSVFLVFIFIIIRIFFFF